MTATWVPNISYIEDYIDRVRATDANRPLVQLDQRTQYLFDMLQASASGELLIAKNVTVAAETIVGTPVYYDEATNSFAPGIAAVDISAGNNYGFAANSAVIRGIVLTKYGSTAGDVALVGKIKYSVWGIDWTTVLESGVIEPGIVYLSAVTAGKMSKSRSQLSVYIGSMTSDADLILNPVVNGNLRDHLHYKFTLLKTVVPNKATEGWAPASEFPLAPAGATHGYVIEKNAALAAAFPPIPVDAHYLSYMGVGVSSDGYVLDANGLWWFGAVAPDSVAVDPSVPSAGLTKSYELWITRLNFGAPFVSTLGPSAVATVIPVRFADTNGNTATSGDLLAYIDQLGVLDPTVNEGGLALKTIVGAVYTMGPVISRVWAGTGITIEGEFGDATEGWYGGITIYSGTSADIAGDPVVVALDNAAEDFYGILPAITFPELRASSILLKINVPTGLPTGRTIKLVLDVIGVGTGTVPLGVSYIKVSTGVPISQTEITLAPISAALVANQAVRVQSAAVAISAGDTIFFRVTQANAALANAVPLLRIQYSIVKV